MERRSRRPYFRVVSKRLEGSEAKGWPRADGLLPWSDMKLPPGEAKSLAVELLNQGASPAAEFHAEVSDIELPLPGDKTSPRAPILPEIVCVPFSRARDVAPGDTVLLGCPVYVPLHALVAIRIYYVDAFTVDPGKDELCQVFGFRLLREGSPEGTVVDADIGSARMKMVKPNEETPCGPQVPQWLKRRTVTPEPPPSLPEPR